MRWPDSQVRTGRSALGWLGAHLLPCPPSPPHRPGWQWSWRTRRKASRYLYRRWQFRTNPPPMRFPWITRMTGPVETRPHRRPS